MSETITGALSDAPEPNGHMGYRRFRADQGMVASMIPFNLQVTATRNGSAGESTTNGAITATGASVNLTRTVEVALLPAFEFGIFCDGDCDYFAGPEFNFGGRVHANRTFFLPQVQPDFHRQDRSRWTGGPGPTGKRSPTASAIQERSMCPVPLAHARPLPGPGPRRTAQALPWEAGPVASPRPDGAKLAVGRVPRLLPSTVSS